MKRFYYLLSLLVLSIGLSGCIGGSGNPTINVPANTNCNFNRGQSCAVNLTYNTGGVKDLELGVKYTNPPQQTNQFNINLTTCPAPATGNQSCTVNITVGPNRSRVQQKIQFTLGTATSKEITLILN